MDATVKRLASVCLWGMSSACSVSSATTAAEPVADLPEGLEWMTPFDETVTLNVCVGWDADSSVKDGTTPETTLWSSWQKTT